MNNVPKRENPDLGEIGLAQANIKNKRLIVFFFKLARIYMQGNLWKLATYRECHQLRLYDLKNIFHISTDKSLLFKQ
jgi:hypothetical protein